MRKRWLPILLSVCMAISCVPATAAKAEAADALQEADIPAADRDSQPGEDLYDWPAFDTSYGGAYSYAFKDCAADVTLALQAKGSGKEVTGVSYQWYQYTRETVSDDITAGWKNLPTVLTGKTEKSLHLDKVSADTLLECAVTNGERTDKFRFYVHAVDKPFVIKENGLEVDGECLVENGKNIEFDEREIIYAPASLAVKVFAKPGSEVSFAYYKLKEVDEGYLYEKDGGAEAQLKKTVGESGIVENSFEPTNKKKNQDFMYEISQNDAVFARVFYEYRADSGLEVTPDREEKVAKGPATGLTITVKDKIQLKEGYQIVSYEWRKDGVVIQGETGDTLKNVSIDKTTEYDCTITDDAGNWTCYYYTYRIDTGLKITEPTGYYNEVKKEEVSKEKPIELSVKAQIDEGMGSLHYQWWYAKGAQEASALDYDGEEEYKQRGVVSAGTGNSIKAESTGIYDIVVSDDYGNRCRARYLIGTYKSAGSFTASGAEIEADCFAIPYYKLVPTTSKTYVFSFETADNGAEVCIYDENRKLVAKKEKSDDELNDTLSVELVADKTYYMLIEAEGYNYYPTKVKIYVNGSFRADETAQDPSKDDPSKDPTQDPSKDEPSKNPTQEPSKDDPTKNPTQDPSKDEPSKNPTQDPAQTPGGAAEDKPADSDKAVEATDGSMVTTSAKGFATLMSVKKTTKKSLKAPSKVTVGKVKYTVNTIGANAFANAKKATTITLPDTVTSIKAKAFAKSKATTVKLTVKKGAKLTINKKAFKSSKVKKVIVTMKKATDKEKKAVKKALTKAGIKEKNITIKK